MAKCMYCLQNDTTTTFNSREHVIPKSLGRFDPLNPTISGNVVCDACNQLFSPLEANFIEDTWEGIHAQRLNLCRQGSLTARDSNYKIERLSGFGDDFFKEMFPFLEFRDEAYVPVLRDQIKLKLKSGGYRIFFPEALEAIDRDSARFQNWW